MVSRPAATALGGVQVLSDMLDADATTRGAQQFPRATSVRMSFVHRQMGGRYAQPTVLKRQLLEPLHLVRLQAAKLPAASDRMSLR